MTTTGFSKAVSYLFKPDFSQVGASTILVALGQAFFSLSLGMGALMTYGSYLSERTSIPGTTVIIAVMDTSVALLAGLAIFPIMFSFGLQPEEGGPGLIFKILPIAFGQMAYGRVLAVIFFTLLMFAAWTSALSILEAHHRLAGGKDGLYQGEGGYLRRGCRLVTGIRLFVVPEPLVRDKVVRNDFLWSDGVPVSQYHAACRGLVDIRVCCLVYVEFILICRIETEQERLPGLESGRHVYRSGRGDFNSVAGTVRFYRLMWVR